MDRDTIKDFLREFNEWILLTLPSILVAMILTTLYAIVSRGIK